MNQATAPLPLRHDWHRGEVEALFALPFADLIFRAQTVHRRFFDPNEVQVSTLLSIKTGTCPEDCKYCPQSVRYDTGLEAEQLMEVERVLESARAARDAGSGEELAVGSRPVTSAGSAGGGDVERRCAAVFAEAQNQRLVQQASLIEIDHQCAERFIERR